jgi:hypothetical protein
MQISQFVLYHGSDTNVKLPVWNLGSRYRDFGQCFYRQSPATPNIFGQMSINYDIVDFHLNEMIQMLVKKCHYTYDTALDIVLSSETYHQLVTRPHLQEEGSLFICELLEKELAGGN